MKVGIVGSGGREHAICAFLKKSDKINEIYCFPGNAGTSSIAKNIDLDSNNFEVLGFGSNAITCSKNGASAAVWFPTFAPISKNADLFVIFGSMCSVIHSNSCNS